MTFPSKAFRIRFAFHQPFMLRVKKPVKSRLFRVSWWCGVDLRVLSPKPRAEGSSPSAPAKEKDTESLDLPRFFRVFFVCWKEVVGDAFSPLLSPSTPPLSRKRLSKRLSEYPASSLLRKSHTTFDTKRKE